MCMRVCLGGGMKGVSYLGPQERIVESHWLGVMDM